jgi:DMSO/TMAO reductase YedYZ molybdopterin-dependent catalytic subunit
MGALLGAITSLPLIAISYLGWRLADLPFIPFDLFDWSARVLPGDLVTLGIDTLVSIVTALSGVLDVGSTSGAAKIAEQLAALLMVVAGGAVLGVVIAWVRRRTDQSGARIGLAAGFVAWLSIVVIELGLGQLSEPILALGWLALLLVSWGTLLGYLLHALQTTAPEETNTARRNALIKIASGSAFVALGGWGLGTWLGATPKETGAGQTLTNLPTATSQSGIAEATPAPTTTSSATGVPELAEATPLPTGTAVATTRDRVSPAPGTRPEVTPNEDFYRIDINTFPVSIDGDTWELEVDGLFDKARPLSLSDLMAYPAVTQPITISCISNPIGGDLIGTSNWTGVRLRDLLKDLGLRPEAKELYIEAEDGFYESVSMEDIMDPRTLLVYGMNGETLPERNGFPLRIYIPNRYGMKQPKWIKRIEAIDNEGDGFWVDRGWSEEARPRIISMIDTVAQDGVTDGKIPVGGIAWAGDRGIQKVELQIDDGEWVEATLRVPTLSPLTWVQWRYDWPATPGRYVLRVRAIDGTGTLQIQERGDAHPDGATGYHKKTVEIKA